MQRYGAPYAGGWMNWPIRWLLPVELALHTYEVLSSVADALGRLEGEALEKWQNRNERLLQQALDIQAIREEAEAADDGG